MKHEQSSENNVSKNEKTTQSTAAESGSPVVKRQKLWLLATAILVVFVVILVVINYLLAAQSKDMDKAAENSVATYFASSQKLVNEATSRVEGKAVDVVTKNAFGGFTNGGYGVYNLPAYQVKGKKFANFPSNGSGAGLLGNSYVAESAYKHFTMFFTGHNFQQLSSLASDPYSYNLPSGGQLQPESYAVYASDNMVCAILHVDVSSVEVLRNHLVSIGCADKNNYDKIANEVQPFYTVYVDGDSNPATGLVFGPPKVSNGVDGYKSAALYIEDSTQVTSDTEVSFFSGLYYLKPNEKNWIYFNGTRGGPIDCAEIETDTLEKEVVKKAFSGLECYDIPNDKIRTITAA